jgi:hypothetical protein
VSKVLTGDSLKVVGADFQLKVRLFCFIAAYMHVIHAANFRVENLVTDIYEFRLRLRPEAGLLNKSSCLAAALGVTNFVFVRDMILVTLCCAT